MTMKRSTFMGITISLIVLSSSAHADPYPFDGKWVCAGIDMNYGATGLIYENSSFFTYSSVRKIKNGYQLTFKENRFIVELTDIKAKTMLFYVTNDDAEWQRCKRK